jgi:hypothetical protein
LDLLATSEIMVNSKRFCDNKMASKKMKFHSIDTRLKKVKLERNSTSERKTVEVLRQYKCHVTSLTALIARDLIMKTHGNE